MPIPWARITELPPVFRFALEGEPIPKGRPRFGKGGRVYTPEETLGGEEQVQLAFTRAHPGAEPIADPVALVCDFYTAHDRRNRAGRADIDNLVKLVQDALNTLAYEDDYQIEIIVATLTTGSDRPGTEVAIYRRE